MQLSSLEAETCLFGPWRSKTVRMNVNRSLVLNKAAWAIGTYGGTLFVRLATSIAIARVLEPEALGILVLANSIRYGIEVLTDIGVEQNIVNSKKGGQESFLSTAWTLQIIRGSLLSILFLSVSPALANFYQVEVYVFAMMSLAPMLNGLSSTSIFLLVRDLEVKRRTLFEVRAELLGFVLTMSLVALHPSVVSVVLGILLSVSVRSALSYRIAHPPHRFRLDRQAVPEIIHFGKWIVLSSLVMYLATNLDRIYLGKVGALAILGVYGLARTISDIPSTLASRLGYNVIFPMLSNLGAREAIGAEAPIRSARLALVCLAALCMSIGVCWADYAIRLLYDSRYHSAGWMLSGLIIGAWFSVLANLNESALLGAGRPADASWSNVVRLAVLIAAYPAGYAKLGMAGAIGSIICAEVARYAAVYAFQRRIRLSFGIQDTVATLVLAAASVMWIGLRLVFEMGTAWQAISMGGAR